MSEQGINHRAGVVVETGACNETRVGNRPPKRYTKCEIAFEPNSQHEMLDLAESYHAGDQTAVIFRGGDYICDINLTTGKQSAIGDRVEGLAALILAISIPLWFVLIGIPIYFGVKLYARVTTQRLRKRVAEYVRARFPSLKPSGRALA